MKKAYSRLCLKERWTLFFICFLIGTASLILAVYGFIKQNDSYIYAGSAIAVIGYLACCYLYCLNKRRRSIRLEYTNEFDRELFSKERGCPKCGATIGSNVSFCPKCGTKFH